MANFIREYSPVKNLGFVLKTIGSPGTNSEILSLDAGQFRGAQVSIEFKNLSTPPDDDLIVEVFASRDAMPPPNPTLQATGTVDSFAAMQFRLHPPPPAGDTKNFTFDVPDTIVGHGFRLFLASSGNDMFEVTLIVQKYKIQSP